MEKLILILHVQGLDQGKAYRESLALLSTWTGFTTWVPPWRLRSYSFWAAFLGRFSESHRDGVSGLGLEKSTNNQTTSLASVVPCIHTVLGCRSQDVGVTHPLRVQRVCAQFGVGLDGVWRSPVFACHVYMYIHVYGYGSKLRTWGTTGLSLFSVLTI